MQTGRLLDRRDAHKALDLERVGLSQHLEKLWQIPRQNTRLLRLCTGVHLNVEPRSTSGLIHRCAQSFRELFTIQRLDDVKERDRIARLVRLQRPDEPELKIRVCVTQFAPVLLGFLDPVFAKDALPGRQCGFNTVLRLAFGYGDERHRFRRAAMLLRRTTDTGQDVLARVFDIEGLSHAVAICRTRALGKTG